MVIYSMGKHEEAKSSRHQFESITICGKAVEKQQSSERQQNDMRNQ
jgi:hypothetical protein